MEFLAWGVLLGVYVWGVFVWAFFPITTRPIPIKDPITSDLLEVNRFLFVFIVSTCSTCSFSIFIALR